MRRTFLSLMALAALAASPWPALAIAALLVGQLAAMRVLIRDPRAKAPWYNATGVLMYVTGMMISAFALRGLA